MQVSNHPCLCVVLVVVALVLLLDDDGLLLVVDVPPLEDEFLLSDDSCDDRETFVTGVCDINVVLEPTEHYIYFFWYLSGVTAGSAVFVENFARSFHVTWLISSKQPAGSLRSLTLTIFVRNRWWWWQHLSRGVYHLDKST